MLHSFHVQGLDMTIPVVNRVAVGLVIFQLTMMGVFVLKTFVAGGIANIVFLTTTAL